MILGIIIFNWIGLEIYLLFQHQLESIFLKIIGKIKKTFCRMCGLNSSQI
jgi:hypothetical protein